MWNPRRQAEFEESFQIMETSLTALNLLQGRIADGTIDPQLALERLEELQGIMDRNDDKMEDLWNQFESEDEMFTALGILDE